MLAYSSIAHAGYLLIGIVAGHAARRSRRCSIYLLIYAFMQLGAFAVDRRCCAGSDVHRRRAEGLQRPALPQSVRGVRDAALHAVARRHSADRRLHGQVLAVQRGDRIAATYWLAVIGVLNSAISLYYYIRIVVFMYLKKETIGSEPATSPALALVLGVAVVGDARPRRLSAAAVRGGRGVGAHARRRRGD